MKDKINKILILATFMILFSILVYSFADIEDLLTIRGKVNLSVTGDINGTSLYVSNISVRQISGKGNSRIIFSDNGDIDVFT